MDNFALKIHLFLVLNYTELKNLILYQIIEKIFRLMDNENDLLYSKRYGGPDCITTATKENACK